MLKLDYMQILWKNKINFFSDKVNVKQKEDIFYIDGNVKNKVATLSKNFLKIVKLNLKNLKKSVIKLVLLKKLWPMQKN